MKRCDFTAQATEDLRQIAHYTKKEWGRDQASRYRQELELALQKLSLNSGLGRSREELSAGLRSFKVASHVAFFLPHPDGITIVRLLHPSRDIERALQPRQPDAT